MAFGMPLKIILRRLGGIRRQQIADAVFIDIDCCAFGFLAAVAGDGYSIGDVVSIPAITGGSATKTDAVTLYTIVDGDLVGDSTDQTLPAEDVLFAQPNDDDEVDLITRNWNSGTGTGANAAVTKYTIKVTGGSAISDEGDLAFDADGALVKEAQGHLVPEIVWNSAVVDSGNSGLSVAYTD